MAIGGKSIGSCGLGMGNPISRLNLAVCDGMLGYMRLPQCSTTKLGGVAPILAGQSDYFNIQLVQQWLPKELGARILVTWFGFSVIRFGNAGFTTSTGSFMAQYGTPPICISS